MCEDPSRPHAGGTYVQVNRLQLGCCSYQSENQDRRCESDCKAKSPVLRRPHDCAETLRCLGTTKVHQIAQQDLFKDEQRGQDCDAWNQAKLKLENSRLWNR